MFVTVKVASGDIANVSADALITAINSEGKWFGGIDGVIMRAAGEMFHAQAAKAMPPKDGQTIIAKGDSHAYNAAFKSVVFVVDDLVRPLREVVYDGLKAASDAGFLHVSLPTIRMGVMIGVMERSLDEAVSEMATGIRKFKANNLATPIRSITIVVYNDKRTLSLLEDVLQPN